MTRLALALCAALAVSCTSRPAEPPPLTADADPANAAELRGKLDEVFRSLDEGTADTVLMSWADAEAVVFDFDANNNPVTKRGTAEIQEFLGEYAKAVKGGGLKISTTVAGADCKSTKVAGFCTAEFDQTFVVNGQSQGPFKFRGTLVARKMAEGWRWLHWHGSFREMPAPAAAPTSGAPPAAAPAGSPGA